MVILASECIVSLASELSPSSPSSAQPTIFLSRALPALLPACHSAMLTHGYWRRPAAAGGGGRRGEERSEQRGADSSALSGSLLDG